MPASCSGNSVAAAKGKAAFRRRDPEPEINPTKEGFKGGFPLIFAIILL